MHATANNSTRSRPFVAVGLVAMALSVVPLSGTAGAQDSPRVIDPEDPCPIAAPPAPFADRDQIAEVHRLDVDCSFAAGIAKGKEVDGDLVYAPRESTRRDQMASFIVRQLEASGLPLPPAEDQGFTDIGGNVHADAINRLAAAGIALGTSETEFSPAELVRRDQMASFMLRATEFAFGTEFEPIEGGNFVDVPEGNVHRDNIDAAFEHFGLVLGRATSEVSQATLHELLDGDASELLDASDVNAEDVRGTVDTLQATSDEPRAFFPAESTRRDQMAAFMVRVLDVSYFADEPGHLR